MTCVFRQLLQLLDYMLLHISAYCEIAFDRLKTISFDLDIFVISYI